jgi:hypothetical protein
MPCRYLKGEDFFPQEAVKFTGAPGTVILDVAVPVKLATTFGIIMLDSAKMLAYVLSSSA